MSNIDSKSYKTSNPWRKPMSNIAWGFVFTVMTFNFLSLQYILPTIGVGLLYIGFSDLRKENKEFNIAWIFSIINMVIHVLSLIYANTPLNINFKNDVIRIFILSAFQVIFLLIFRKGLKKVFEKADARPSKDPLLGVIIWRIVILIFVIEEFGSVWYIYIPVIFFYFYNFRLLYKLGDDLSYIKFNDLDDTVRLTSKKHVWQYIIGCAFIVIICILGSNHIRLNSTEFISTKISESRDKLMNIGFPKVILKDISDDEVDILKDAIHIDVSSELLMFDPSEETIKDESGIYNTIHKPGKSNLKTTTIYVELKDNRMYAIEYFQWLGGSAYWHDGFTISGSEKLELINGRLLYEKNGTSYSADIPRLKNEMISQSDLFGYESQSEKIAGAVNYPFGSDRQRGYVFYQLDIRKDVGTGCNIFNYVHYSTPFRSSYEETERKNLMFTNKLRQHGTSFTIKSYRKTNE
ncbi:hypothetical protein FC826_00510 [Clostridium botulinum]|uniref:Uncharacterized protein n=1 Tax=Clostridium botulinum TaxID=1491 RepID=A0A6B4JSU4_CLOBO|nr:hypothetical protein [Clostridium botulinum]NFD83480.1 hypothetical protein [Clostridium botulinum]NFE08174.1 hypothetical protein [Clostridium botulinum]NFE33202.1 hypothetical protein [Clostridium botulinum]NFE47795.1 hypothetical protein [Clostridium botulinum]